MALCTQTGGGDEAQSHSSKKRILKGKELKQSNSMALLLALAEAEGETIFGGEG
jgi:hypothetical protein